MPLAAGPDGERNRAQVFSVLLGGGGVTTWMSRLPWFLGGRITASFSILDIWMTVAGIAAMASVFFATLAYLHGQTLVTTLAAACSAQPRDFCVEFQAGENLYG